MGHRTYGSCWASEVNRTSLALLGIPERDIGGFCCSTLHRALYGYGSRSGCHVTSAGGNGHFSWTWLRPGLTISSRHLLSRGHGVGAKSRAMDGDTQAWLCLPSVCNRRVAPLGAGSTVRPWWL